MKTTRTFMNETETGNVASFDVIVSETPHAAAGECHVSVDVVLRDGSRSTRVGEYCTTEEAAAKAEKFSQMAAAQGLVEKKGN